MLWEPTRLQSNRAAFAFRIAFSGGSTFQRVPLESDRGSGSSSAASRSKAGCEVVAVDAALQVLQPSGRLTRMVQAKRPCTVHAESAQRRESKSSFQVFLGLFQILGKGALRVVVCADEAKHP